MTPFSNALGSWEASLPGELVKGGETVGNSTGHVHLFDARAQPEFVPTSQGPLHSVFLFTGGVARAEERIAGATPFLDRLIGPGDLHVYSPALNATDLQTRWDRPHGMVSVALDPVRVARAAAGVGVHYDAIEFADRFPARDALLDATVRALASEVAGGSPGGTLYAEHLLDAVAVHLVRHHAVNRPPIVAAGEAALSPDRLRRVTDYARTCLDREIRVTDLATQACISPFHFSRAFKRATGETPAAFVQRLRIEEAARLLATTDERVGNVALRVGYADHSSFAAAFRRRLGIGPEAYRRATK